MDAPQVHAFPKTVGSIVHNAIRFWELRRVLYNLALTFVAIAWLASTWPHFHSAFTLHSLFALLALAALANACYCAAYLADIPMQLFFTRDVLQRRRWWLWLGGTLFAVVLECYWIG